MSPTQEPQDPKAVAEAQEAKAPLTDDEVLAQLDPGEDSMASLAASMERVSAHEDLADAEEEAVEEAKAEEAKARDPERNEKYEALRETAKEDDDLEAALLALRRWKAPKDVVASMTPDQIKAWGSQVAKMQGDIDQAYTDLRELKHQKVSPEKPDGEAKTEAAPPDIDLSATTTKLGEVLGLDEQEVKILEQSFKAMVSPLAQRLEARDQRDQARDSVLASILLGDSRRRLQERFPQLADEAQFERVKEKTGKLMQSGQYDDLAAAMEDASRVLFFDDARTARQSQQEKNARVRAQGVPAAPGSRPSPAALSIDDRLDAVLAKIEAGATEDEARAAGGW